MPIVFLPRVGERVCFREVPGLEMHDIHGKPVLPGTLGSITNVNDTHIEILIADDPHHPGEAKTVTFSSAGNDDDNTTTLGMLGEFNEWCEAVENGTTMIWLQGNLSDGFQAFGPFYDPDHCARAAEGDEGWMMTLIPGSRLHVIELPPAAAEPKPADDDEGDFTKARYHLVGDPVPREVLAARPWLLDVFDNEANDYEPFETLFGAYQMTLVEQSGVPASAEQFAGMLQDLYNDEIVDAQWPVEVDRTQPRHDQRIQERLADDLDVEVPLEEITQLSDADYWDLATYLLASILSANDNPVWVPPKPAILKDRPPAKPFQSS